jgi:hypothetical protein
LTLFVESARTFLSENFRAFVVTLVGGMIFVIILLIIQISTFKPVAFSKGIYDNEMCPDYWVLQKVPSAEVERKGAHLTNAEKLLMSYRCVPQENVYSQDAKYYSDGNNGANVNGYSMTGTNPFVTLSATDLTDKKATSRFLGGSGTHNKKLAWKMAPIADTNAIGSADAATVNQFDKLYCNQVYPQLLAGVESTDKDLKDFPGVLRCAYAQKCGIPWTAVCPQKEDTPTQIY